MVNAFDWKAYTDEEHAKNGDPFAGIKRSAVISANVTAGVHRLRERKPSHGTIHGLTNKVLQPKATEMMHGKGGARANAGRKLPNIDERRAMRMLNDGLTKKEIAIRFGVPYKSMLTFFKKMGAKESRGEYVWSGKYKKVA
jgi:hypothetical protein